MFSRDYLASMVVRTPFEGLANSLRWASGYGYRRKHPELDELFQESSNIEAVLRRELTPTSNCIDVGCHLGSMLSLLLKLAPRGRHTAFEPLPDKAAWLRRKFPEVDVRGVALGETNGEVTFYHNTDRSGHSSLVRLNWGDHVVELRVPCGRLDDEVKADLKVDFLKIDVEGIEASVLRGGESVLRRDRPILLFESTRSDEPELARRPAELFDLIVEEFGYNVFTPKDFLEGSPPLDRDRFEG